ncbi:MAG: glycoside hydrolase family 78 protein [Actinomycetota bacterium]
MTTVTGLRCEYLKNPIGIDAVRPRLSWRTVTDQPDWHQSAYEIEVVDDDTGQAVWSSGRIDGPDAVLVDWGGPPLSARQRCRWRVRVWGPDPTADPTPWADDARFELGLLTPDDWSARFITPAVDDGGVSGTRPSPYLRRPFAIDGEVAHARLYVSALGVYEVECNGRRVGDHVLAPGWSSYDHRLRVQTHDVTDLLLPGENAIGAVLADGWARGNLIETRARYTDRLALIAQLEVTYTDGRRVTVATDAGWKTTDTGPIRAADLYNGETYDARRQLDHWSQPGYDDTSWGAVEAVARDLTTLCAPPGPPVRRVETVAAVSVSTAPSGETIVDFGQNLVGWVRLRVRGPAGTTVVIRHAEVLEDGELAVRPLRAARATDEYTLRGDPGGETWEPRFTFHGFRYAGVSGWPGALTADSIEAVVVHSDMTRTGWFACSNDLVNQLHENIVWGMRGNFLDLPTDCPQRSERLGWTGDIQVFGPTATLLYDVSGVLASWLADLAAEQTADGTVPYVVPAVLEGMAGPTCGWGDVATILPMTLYGAYADRALLARQLASMRAWVDCEAQRAGDDLIWSGDFQFGDWLDPAAPPDDPSKARTDPDLLATAFFAHSARLVGAAAAVLGDADTAHSYAEIGERVVRTFADEFTTPNGRVIGETQTGYAIALAFDLLNEDQRRGAIERFAAAVRREGYRIGTGFLGTPWVCATLADHGRPDLAYRVLLNRRCPSWLYAVEQGATTIWERWDALRPDGSLNPGEMLSFNHYAFGAIGAWLYHAVAGLRPDPSEPGWRRFRVEPRPGGDLTSAQARVDTPHGIAAVGWAIVDEALTLDVTVPPNTRASVIVPGGDGERLDVGAGSHSWTVPLDPATLAEWLPGTFAMRPGPHSLMSDVAVDPIVMDVIISVGVKVMAVGGADVVGALSVQELIEQAGLDDEEAQRLLDAVAAL